MSTERRIFRPFDVPAPLAGFLASARLMIAEDSSELIHPSKHQVDPADLAAGVFDLVLADDDEMHATNVSIALESANEEYGENAVELAVVVSSGYLKLAEVAVRANLDEVGRMVRIRDGAVPPPFKAIHHGCDVDAYLVLGRDTEQQPLRPWRKATWLSHARFELRTGLDGVGFKILPLTDEFRTENGLHMQTLRYVSLDVSPLEATATSTVSLYVDSELLARLKREPRKSWAKAFTDQIAVDVLTAIAIRALSDETLRDKDWSEIEDMLLGALIKMVAGAPSADEEKQRQLYERLLEELRSKPQRFLALIEGAVEMRKSSKFLVGS